METKLTIQEHAHALHQERENLLAASAAIRTREEIRALLVQKVKEMREWSPGKGSNWSTLCGYVHGLAYGEVCGGGSERVPQSLSMLFAALTLVAGADRTEAFVQDVIRICLHEAPDVPTKAVRDQRIADIDAELPTLQAKLEEQQA